MLNRLVFLILPLALCGMQSANAQQEPVKALSTGHLSRTVSQLAKPASRGVLVAAHRGDWRNAPENSLPALQNSISMGVDIIEFDLKMTKDSQLIIMHDRTIDRTTDGKGRADEYTLEQIRRFRLRNGLGRVTNNIIPTFEEYLDLSKGRIVLDVDKGFDYFPQVIKMLREKKMIDYALINVDDNSTLDEVEARYGKVDEDIWLMPIVNYKDTAKARSLVQSYLRHRKTIFQPVWSNDSMIGAVDFIKLKNAGYGVWLNSLWPSLNGGHDDDRAVESVDPANSWGWLIKRGATIIQSDRPKELLEYLK